MKLFEKWEYDDFVAIEVVLLNIRIKLVKINVMKIVILITNYAQTMPSLRNRRFYVDYMNDWVVQNV
jgi:hypothetical protein